MPFKLVTGTFVTTRRAQYSSSTMNSTLSPAESLSFSLKAFGNVICPLLVKVACITSSCNYKLPYHKVRKTKPQVKLLRIHGNFVLRCKAPEVLSPAFGGT
jgi:hypothetical protein